MSVHPLRHDTSSNRQWFTILVLRPVAHQRYSSRMSNVISQRELRNDSGAIMRRVEEGERFTVTRNGSPVADLVPHSTPAAERPRFVAVADIAAGLDRLPPWGVERFTQHLLDLDDAVDDSVNDPW
jgi:prevent-host-death family protein